MRIPFICANWKMYKTVDEAVKYVNEFRTAAKDLDGVEIVLAPSFVALHSSVEAARNSNIGIGAQDLFWEREGPSTGEVSGPMLREAGVEYVIVGHSERRALFGETDAIVNRKIAAAFAFGLCPIACIGETLDQRERNETFELLDQQIKVGLDGLTSERIAQLVIAYEPVWAIGTGRNATPAQAAEAHGHIRKRLRQWFGHDSAELCHVIYGGSVKPDNTTDLMSQPDVDGALVGGASLDVRSFLGIVSLGRQAFRARQTPGGPAGAV
jgi:triosephosphate isomerase